MPVRESVTQAVLKAQSDFTSGAGQIQVFSALLNDLRRITGAEDGFLIGRNGSSSWQTYAATCVIELPGDGASLKMEPPWVCLPLPGSAGNWLGLRNPRMNIITMTNELAPALGSLTLMMGTTVDVGQYKKMQHDLLEAQKTMIESAKFSALGVMAAGIAHEINNPLAIIQAYSDILDDFENLTQAKTQRCRQAILRSVDRISKIVRGLRKVARDAEGDPFEVVDVRTVIDEIMGFSLERILHLGIDFRVHCEEGLSLYCQPVQISQVLLNLLNNSIDALEGSGERWISIEAKKERGRAVLRFSDSGPGIPEKIRGQIFEPFFTTKQVGKGTGLGLSISRSIIHDHGGVFYLSDETPTTCFVLEFPLANVSVQSA